MVETYRTYPSKLSLARISPTVTSRAEKTQTIQGSCEQNNQTGMLKDISLFSR